MIDEYNKTSLWYGIPGLCMQGLGGAMGGLDRHESSTLGAAFLLIGTVLLIIGLCYYAKAKGQPASYGLFGFASCIGLLILALLPDRTRGGQEQITANAVGTSSSVLVTERMTGSAVGTPTVGRSDASYQVSMPGILLIALGGLTTAISLLGVVTNAAELFNHESTEYMSAVVGVISLIQVFLGGLVLFGGLKMRGLTNYRLALAASLIVLIPYPCLGVGIPVGVWALVVLSKPAVKAAFSQT